MLRAGGGWTEKVLYRFRDNFKDAAWPYASLIFDAVGNLYGTTIVGGTHGYGAVFELTPKTSEGWTERVLHSFNYDGKDGNAPYAGLIFDTAGNLYGTTLQGGTYGTGTVFELTPKVGGGWIEEILHNFPNNDGKDGYYSNAPLVLGAAGSLYGTTRLGGTYNYGTVFELTPKGGGRWIEKVLHSFNLNSADGYYPYAGLALDAAGNLYGTTSDEGYGWGTVFELMPKEVGGWKERLLHNFNFNHKDGTEPYAGVTLDAAGTLYGTTLGGGVHGYGTVFEITP